LSRKINVKKRQRFNRWVVIKEVKQKCNQRRFLCRCDCGTVRETPLGHLVNGSSKSCGCYHKEIATQSSSTHKKSKTKIYKLYHGIKKRCYNENTVGFEYWGGKGIKMCDKWLSDFEIFETWALNNGYEEGLSIERLNNEEDYCPENCIFIPRNEQPLNQTKRKDNTSGYTGVYVRGKDKDIYYAMINFNKINNNLGTFSSKRKAVMARNYFIINNNLPHKLQVLK